MVLCDLGSGMDHRYSKSRFESPSIDLCINLCKFAIDDIQAFRKFCENCNANFRPSIGVFVKNLQANKFWQTTEAEPTTYSHEEPSVHPTGQHSHS